MSYKMLESFECISEYKGREIQQDHSTKTTIDTKQL